MAVQVSVNFGAKISFVFDLWGPYVPLVPQRSLGVVNVWCLAGTGGAPHMSPARLSRSHLYSMKRFPDVAWVVTEKHPHRSSLFSEMLLS